MQTAEALYKPWEEEGELIRQAKAAWPEAWARIYDAYAERLYLYALARTGSRQAAEDITSLVFLKALKTIASYNPARRPLLAWLYGIARHVPRSLSMRPPRCPPTTPTHLPTAWTSRLPWPGSPRNSGR